jgi:8-oxo-dGTP pyrophosphatase MutT (NUDIX family)
MDIKQKLLACFAGELPGRASHLGMAPIYRRDEIDKDYPDSAVKSSVLILYYLKRNEPYVVFIRRPIYKGVHSGQIALPGGRWEITDKSLYHTALRESAEEIGIFPEEVEYCGKLTDLYIPPSNYIVSPFVGLYKGVPHLRPDTIEVQEIIEIPFSLLLDETFRKVVTIEIDSNVNIEAPCFEISNNIIWGATAMMLNEMIILWKSTV